jgi:shikimate dehydrogenase
MGAATRRSILTGLLGQGVGPSLSPELHEREAARHGLRYVYKVVDLDEEDLDRASLKRLLNAALRLGFDGLNVTHPVKQAMVPLVAHLAPAVEMIGALNTILVDDGITVGHNTDVTGFRRAFSEGFPSADLTQVVLLGAGGAGTAVAHALADLGTHRISVFDPDAERVATLVRSLGRARHAADVDVVDAGQLTSVLSAASGVVNATPVGMAAHPGSPVAAELVDPPLWVADIVYRPLVTELLDTARARGCRTLSGAGMAVHQAADAFELFTGRTADRAAMTADFDELVALEMEAGDRNDAMPRALNRERKQ